MRIHYEEKKKKMESVSLITFDQAVSASELEPEEIPFEQQYPELKDVQNSLDSDEIVTANDIELAYGQEFEVEVDLSGIEGVDEKVEESVWNNLF